mgnify:CR=1 FL=1
MENKSKYSVATIKWIVSIGLLVAAFQYIDWTEAKRLIGTIRWGWIVLAFLLFVGAQFVRASRLLALYQCLGSKISVSQHLRIFWVSLFYSRVMPLGNGHAISAFYLNQQFGAPIKSVTTAIRLDKLSEALCLLFLACIGLLIIQNDALGSVLFYGGLAVVFLVIPLYSYWVGKHHYIFHSAFWLVNFHSLAVSFMQILSAYFVLRSLGVASSFLEYQTLFLLSAVAALFPYTLGGLGLREVVFIIGASMIGLSGEVGLLVGLFFFCFQLLTAMAGGFLHLKKETFLSSPTKKRFK